MSLPSSTKVKNKDIILNSTQRILFASGDEINYTTVSGINSDINALTASLPVSVYSTITSGTITKYIEFGTAQVDTNYYVYATTTYSGAGIPIGIGCTTYSGTTDGVYVALTDLVPADGYGVNLLITR